MKRAGVFLSHMLHRHQKCMLRCGQVCRGMIPALLFFSSCAAPFSVTIDTLEPSWLARKYHPGRLAVVDNARWFESFEHKDTLVLACPTGPLAASVAQRLSDSEAFDKVMLMDTSLCTRDSLARWEMTDSVVSAMAKDLGVDMLLTVNLAYAKIGRYTVTPERNEIKAEVIWSLYAPGHSGALESFRNISSLWYAGTSIQQKELEEELINTFSEAVTRKTTPYWTESYRVLYTSLASDLRYGYLAYSHGEYEEARRIWTETAQRSSYRKLRAAAYVNLAFLHEIEDDFSGALTCLEQAEQAMGEKSYSTMRGIIGEYRKLLEQRKEHRKHFK